MKIQDFLYNVQGYLAGNLTNAPSLVTPQNQQVAFLDRLLESISPKQRDYARDIEAILRYGYVGATRGRNGISDITARDKNLVSSLDCFLQSCEGSRMLDKYRLKGRKIKGVKVVVHRKNGVRIFGVYGGGKFVLVGRAGYKK